MVADITVVVTDEYKMRGVDYNTKDPKGISLLMMRKCSSERAFY